MKRALLILIALSPACGASQPGEPVPVKVPVSELPSRFEGFEVAEPRAVGLSPEKITRLIARAREERSDALIVLKDGKLVVQEHFGAANADKPIFAMSVTKSVVAMAYGSLLTRGQIKGLDIAISTWLPELEGSDKARITLRQLLTHTSGIDATRVNLQEKGILDHVLASPLTFEPGSHVEYNNNTCDFLSALFPRLSGGLYIDDYLQREIFGPLGVVGAHWMKDRYGVARGAGELAIRAIDLAKLGQLMLNRGEWRGQRILDASWVDVAVEPGQHWYEGWGQLWWREADYDYVLSETSLQVWAQLGIATQTLDAVRPLLGQRLQSREALMDRVRETLGSEVFQVVKKKLAAARTRAPFDKRQRGPLRAYYGEGWLGQYLVVVPSANLVAVRMRAYSDDAAKDPMAFSYSDFPKDVIALAAAAAE